MKLLELLFESLEENNEEPLIEENGKAGTEVQVHNI